MSRTTGAKNIKNFDLRESIETSSGKDIKHLSESSAKSALDQFITLLNHQRNYLKWIETRHSELMRLKAGNGTRARGPKDSTYRKYKWYAEQAALLEAINAFEVFYKRSMINLAKALRNYVQPEKIKGSLDAKILWSMSGKFSIAELIFEHQLYHNLDSVDQATESLISAKFYKKDDKKSKRSKKNTCLQAIFQVRHTLSHNHGLVTRSDNAKLKMLAFKANSREIIDPDKNDFGHSISRFLETEAKAFTDWLVSSTAKYLGDLSTNLGVVLEKSVLSRIEKGIGASAALSALTWV